MIYKIIFSLILTAFFSESIFSQSYKKIDSLIQSFLIENKILDTIIFNQSKQKNILIEESNYCKKECVKIRTNGKDFVTGIKFSGNASFREFVLFDVVDSGSHKYFFIGKDGFETDLKKIKDLLCFKKFFFTVTDKKKTYGVLMNIYINVELNKDCYFDNVPNYIL